MPLNQLHIGSPGHRDEPPSSDVSFFPGPAFDGVMRSKTLNQSFAQSISPSLDLSILYVNYCIAYESYNNSESI